jgi:hypothetical protein
MVGPPKVTTSHPVIPTGSDGQHRSQPPVTQADVLGDKKSAVDVVSHKPIYPSARPGPKSGVVVGQERGRGQKP